MTQVRIVDKEVLDEEIAVAIVRSSPTERQVLHEVRCAVEAVAEKQRATVTVLGRDIADRVIKTICALDGFTSDTKRSCLKPAQDDQTQIAVTILRTRPG